MRRELALKVGTLLAAVALLAGVVPVMVSAAGSGPDDALTPSSDWQPIYTGEEHWYSFEYAGDGSRVDVELRTEPVGGANFAIWTPDEIRRWALGLEVDPVGRGSEDPAFPGGSIWSGGFTVPGAYYVVVEDTSGQPGARYYQLSVTGDGVSQAASSPDAEAAPAPTKTKSRKPVPSNPDGKLAFQTSPGGDIYTVGVDGSNLQRIADGMDPVWSPDGEQIAFARWREPRGIWVAKADGSGEWRIFDWSEARWPSWSSDGVEILFTRQHLGREDDSQRCFFGFCFSVPANPHWRLGIVDTWTQEFREPAASKWSRAPYWSPTAASYSPIVYADKQGLHVQTEDGSVSYFITDDGLDTSPIWSPEGSQVAFVRKQHDHWEIYLVGTGGENLTRLTTTSNRPDGTPGNSVSPAWSPDGQHIAFLTDRTGQWEIWVMRSDGSQQKPMFMSALDGLTLDYGFVGDRAISWAR
ncbi:TolB family protein [Chloroflexota bacterium]